MINVWADLSKMKREFPIGEFVLINEAAGGSLYGEEIIGKIAKIEGYAIESSMLFAVLANGMEIALYPDEVEIYFVSQVCYIQKVSMFIRFQRNNHWVRIAESKIPIDLDLYPDTQYVQNESTNIFSKGIRSTFDLKYSKVLPQSTSFTVYIGNVAVQIGMDRKQDMVLTKIGNPEFYAEVAELNLATGQMTLRFNKEVPDHYLVVSYEYSYEFTQTDQ